VAAAKKRLDSVNANLESFDDSMRHYFAQVNQVQRVAKVSAQVDLVWPDLQGLQHTYAPYSKSDGQGEDKDNLAPLRGPRSNPLSERRQSMNGNARPNPSKRKATMQIALPQIIGFGMTPWPRRSSLDPTGTSRVDPIRRLELTLDHARSQGDDMLRRRAETTRELQSMIGRIDALIRQKDAVRSWTKAALEQNRSLQLAVDSLNRQIRGDSRARMGRMKDRIYDTLVRQLLSPLFRGIFGVFYIGRWVWGLRSSRTRQESVRGLKGAPWGVWGFAALIVGLGLFFYYIGG